MKRTIIKVYFDFFIKLCFDKSFASLMEEETNISSLKIGLHEQLPIWS